MINTTYLSSIDHYRHQTPVTLGAPHRPLLITEDRLTVQRRKVKSKKINWGVFGVCVGEGGPTTEYTTADDDDDEK